MNKKEWIGQKLADLLIGFLSVSVFLMINRLWPFVFLGMAILLVLFVKAVFAHSKDGEESVICQHKEAIVKEPIANAKELCIFMEFEKQVTELVKNEFPNARWVWECPDAFKEFLMGNDIYIILNKAGGYKRANVIYRGLKAYGLSFDIKERELDEPPEAFFDSESLGTNYELLAFEWCEAHKADLEERCKDIKDLGQKEMLISSDELPAAESWECIQKELVRDGFLNARCMTDGILIIL